MDDIKLDDNYNFFEEKNPYSDDFIDTAGEIIKAKTEKKISESEASFLFKLLLRKELNKEISNVISFAKSKGY
jgi:hypothetical protein